MNAVDSHNMAGKEAAAREREDRLNAARKKLKTYRARQPKNTSTVSNSDSVASTSSPAPSKRSSLIATSGGQNLADAAGGHKHRRSISKSITGPPPASPAGARGHGRKASKSRASLSGHTHTRSRASVSISVSVPSTANTPSHATALPDEPVVAPSPTRSEALTAPTSWSASGQFPSSPDAPVTKDEQARSDFDDFGSSQNAANLLFMEAIEHAARASLPPSAHTPTRSISASNATPGSSHSRKPSRHNRQTSVSNFRESIEIMSGTGTFLGGLQPGVSSFA